MLQMQMVSLCRWQRAVRSSLHIKQMYGETPNWREASGLTHTKPSDSGERGNIDAVAFCARIKLIQSTTTSTSLTGVSVPIPKHYVFASYTVCVSVGKTTSSWFPWASCNSEGRLQMGCANTQVSKTKVLFVFMGFHTK